jgi:hypothetical protein
MDQAFSQRQVKVFDASLLYAIFVVHVVAYIWTKEERGNKGMENYIMRSLMICTPHPLLGG